MTCPEARNGSWGLLALFAAGGAVGTPPVTITCKSGDSLDHVADGSIDIVVMDPPYYDNVMYAELSDFFYVWLKRTAGHVFPELFRQPPDRQGQRGRGQSGAIPRSEGAPRHSRSATTRNAWRPSSPSAGAR